MGSVFSKPSRRAFIAGTGAATLMTTGVFGAATRKQSSGKLIDEQSFARLEEIGDGVWAVLSTPVNANGGFETTTLSNAGLIMGDDKVVVYDAFFRPEGAAWLSEHAKKLTGRYPTHVIVSHLHADHCGGLAGFQRGSEGPEIIMTEVTRDLIFETYGKGEPRENEIFGRPPIRLLGPTQILHDESKPVSLDLGGRSISIDPLAGHTPSDLAVHISDADIIFASDLVWEGYFPNYVNAVPSKLVPSVKHLFKNGDNLMVSGHGGIAKAKDLDIYLELLEAIDKGAKEAHALGLTAEEGGAIFISPEATKNWIRFNPQYPTIAYQAWYRELGNNQ
ncbi:MBL fold metallo-hydrolase [Kordiimonas sp. SCSIO 12610]|uniref:MBL fold metallo-hydrolase n=1 Tax=Kordiimonas sp. SCSIO 12610 TaxID=2829597 RepID=UPI00210EC302|nr:MBL fold metallo-hydrolase [Kordiimonas sp. SCSIO 12610]UTW55755.1 MBL fold metallo-hydrolase [Kordiimonas sp. SCSIO 12610]